jgi:hypothetical protein
MVAGECEAAADQRKIPAAIVRHDPALAHGRKNRRRINWGQGHPACEAERPPAWQQEAIARFQLHCTGNAFHRQPALARNHCPAFDAVLLVRELD